MSIEKGNRVSVRCGTGTVVGFEVFTRNGNSEKLSDTQSGDGRVAIKLDEGHTWSFDDKLYYAYPKEIQRIH